MTLEEFIEEEKRLLDIFKARWEQRAGDEPDDFPLSMEPQDWYEHFEMSK